MTRGVGGVPTLIRPIVISLRLDNGETFLVFADMVTKPSSKWHDHDGRSVRFVSVSIVFLHFWQVVGARRFELPASTSRT